MKLYYMIMRLVVAQVFSTIVGIIILVLLHQLEITVEYRVLISATIMTVLALFMYFIVLPKYLK